MIQKMPHYGHDLANKNYKQIIQNVWDKLNELIDFANAHTHPAEETKKYKDEIEKQAVEIESLEFKLEKYRTALEKIAEYMMPAGQIKERDITLNNMTDLSHCIQDMAGLAKQALGEE